MQPITTFTSTVLTLPVENIDTDQIIPARYLKVTDKAGLGDALFADWRYDADGNPRPDFILNRPGAQDSQVLLAGHNFGCGSSREHAPWALVGFGFRAVLSTYFADIFRNNALKNGLLPIVLDAQTHTSLLRQADETGGLTVSVDLERQSLRLPDGSAVEFPLDPFAKHCLLNGLDQFGFLVAAKDAIEQYERTNEDRKPWSHPDTAVLLEEPASRADGRGTEGAHA